MQNRIKFKIDDMVGNKGESGEYTVRIDAADPEVPVVSSTHPDALMIQLENKRFKLDVHAWPTGIKRRMRIT